MMAKAVNWIFACLLFAAVVADQWLNSSAWLYAGVIAAYVAIQVYGSAVLSAGFYLPVLWRGQNSEGVAITFDDGPVAERTDKILDILEKYSAPAAFFCIGSNVEKNPQIVRRMHEAGHLVGNHSFFHRATFDLQSASAIESELQSTDESIARVMGRRPLFFRPPYGVTNPMVAAAVRRGKYKTIGWSIRSFDTVIEDRTRLLRRVTRSLRGGDIILLHDHGKCTVDILAELLQQISALGLKIVRVDQLVNEKAYVQA